ncbi:MAG: hypothetical protein L0G87_08420 [Renibacterium salmoninarum]|nr:hypothetical protein [Renibacterium salmoninarum]
MRKLTGLLVALLTFCALLTGLAPATASSQAEAAISAAYNRPGVAAGLGWATGPVSCGLKNGGCYQSYQKGAIVWSPATGAQPVLGGIRQVWGQYKFEDGPLGYPTGPETCGLKGNGCRQNFQNGAVLWSPTAGGWPTWYAIKTAWEGTGAQNGQSGYPTGAESCNAGQCRQNFQGGYIL